MIILDTNILCGFTPESSNADLDCACLRARQAACRVDGIPAVTMTEGEPPTAGTRRLTRQPVYPNAAMHRPAPAVAAA
ncbi:hypothetical protein ACFV80_42230 [Streptomyces sp. NPDC059862]|uniref:hypothetical protein n=1 Tax=Streptomyces sp. NPDC059862 TaxID=3346975 RepID=UPI0036491260